jgi:hypothetical protein
MSEFFTSGAPLALLILVYGILLLGTWVALVGAVVELAASKGRNQWLWAFAACFVISPFLALIALRCMTPNEDKLVYADKSQLCPLCISLIDARARRCPKCCADISK